MTRQNEYAKAMEEYAKNCDFSFIGNENSLIRQHIMLIEEKNIANGYQPSQALKKENSLLEKIDLIDFRKLENGRTNKTR